MSALAHAVALIRRWESCRLSAYLCPAGVWTIGWGSTGPGIASGAKWSQSQADERLAHDVKRFMDGVRSVVKVELSDNELGALTSLAYNIGAEAFRRSTLLTLLNRGDKKGAARQFDLWNKAKGRVLTGLVARRANEREVFEQRAEADEAQPAQAAL
jgi:lysozyme